MTCFFLLKEIIFIYLKVDKYSSSAYIFNGFDTELKKSAEYKKDA